MSAELAGSIGRISALVDRVLECADWPSDPRSGDAWWRLAASTLPAQVLVLQCAAGTAPTITAMPSAVSGGASRSLSARIGAAVSGHAMPMAGSSQRTLNCVCGW